MKRRFVLRGEAGFGLAEVLVAIGVITVTFGAITTLILQSFNARRVVRDELVAANLALEGVELIRAIRDGNWVWSGTPKRADNNGSICGGAAGSVTSWRWRLCNTVDDRIASNRNFNLSPILLPTGNNNLLNRQANGEYTYDASGTPTPFRRVITISTPPDDPGTPLRNEAATEMIVRVDIRWCPTLVTPPACPGKQRTLTVEDRLLNWIPRTRCSDGLDNDSDGSTDLADAQCVNALDDDESL